MFKWQEVDDIRNASQSALLVAAGTRCFQKAITSKVFGVMQLLKGTTIKGTTTCILLPSKAKRLIVVHRIHMITSEKWMTI